MRDELAPALLAWVHGADAAQGRSMGGAAGRLR